MRYIIAGLYLTHWKDNVCLVWRWTIGHWCPNIRLRLGRTKLGSDARMTTQRLKTAQFFHNGSSWFPLLCSRSVFALSPSTAAKWLPQSGSHILTTPSEEDGLCLREVFSKTRETLLKPQPIFLMSHGPYRVLHLLPYTKYQDSGKEKRRPLGKCSTWRQRGNKSS